MKCRYEKIRNNVYYVYNYYDHPLGGYAIINNTWYSFKVEYESNWAELTKLTLLQKINAWRRATTFGIMVGWHWHYKNGQRRVQFSIRRPKFLYMILFNLYYSKRYVKNLNDVKDYIVAQFDRRQKSQ